MNGQPIKWKLIYLNMINLHRLSTRRQSLTSPNIPASLAQYIPRASLAGLLMLAAFRMVDRKQLNFHLRATRFDAGSPTTPAASSGSIRK